MSAALRIALLTALTLCCFAANSILTRVALRDGGMDGLAFAVIRVASGALMLLFLLSRRGEGRRALAGDWPSALALVIYAAAFSVAYLSIPSGTGALILFGSVQVTMIGAGLIQGERPPWQEWGGVLVSMSGLLVFLLPGLQRPPLAGSVLMLAAGMAWAAYSLRGRGNRDPLAATAGNFVRGLPLVLVPWVLFGSVEMNPVGVACALASGALASGLGYALWYTVLPMLTALRASLVQLAVPVLVTVFGVLFLGEPLGLRLLTGMAMIVGGLAMATLYRAGRLKP
ncbi:DMT family transporter [Nevskia sp.]|uniref:DMT family transporter n=1 Tax=Nevskia sp. TaxID=1929292 RepID=UPI0025D6C04C|nr:DMT family transporter [Nevskia sp.]